MAGPRSQPKYVPFDVVPHPARRWPDRRIERAPVWCSVDLRDGNQALAQPMDLARKRRLFAALLEMGFKQIEVGFPAASATESRFVRGLIADRAIPDDVTIQVLTQAREEQITTTMEALRGAPRAIVHLYNSTSPVQRRVVFGMSKAEVIELAVRGARQIRMLAERMPETDVTLEYSPESFTQTELAFAAEITNAVVKEWPLEERKMIVNLPATVEVSTPNVFADSIELFARALPRREDVVLSVHPHNDRGTAVAAAELALLAGADRVEGTLFGNGERTGNVDVVTLALNLASQGIDPGLDIHDIDAIREVAEACTGMPVHPRHPYAGALVYTAFSGSHQDAIHKALRARRHSDDVRWQVPYLPIDPADVGRELEEVVRVNSQSGKGGVAHALERDFGLVLPRGLQIEFGALATHESDVRAVEMVPDALFELFERTYLDPPTPIAVLDLRRGPGENRFEFAVEIDGVPSRLSRTGTGPIDALAGALGEALGIDFEVRHYSEHALREGGDACAIAYVEIEHDGRSTWGVAYDTDLCRASLAALARAAGRARDGSHEGA